MSRSGMGKSRRKKVLHSLYGMPSYICAHYTTMGMKVVALGTIARRKGGSLDTIGMGKEGRRIVQARVITANQSTTC